MQCLAKKINSVYEAPAEDAYILCNLNGGLYYVTANNYLSFSKGWLSYPEKYPLAMDLASTPAHAIILDFDYKDSEKPSSSLLKETLDQVENQLKLLIFPHVQHFTYLVTKRKNSHGFHIHLPEFSIAFDDYILLCQRLQEFLTINSYKLDILTNAMLPLAAKIPGDPYEPCMLRYVDEQQNYTINMPGNFLGQAESLKKQMKRLKSNKDSLFRKVLVLSNEHKTYLNLLMMPVVSVIPPLWRCSYATSITNTPNESTHHEDVATFSYMFEEEKMGYVIKGKQLSFSGLNFLKTFYYFRFNPLAISKIETNNHALRVWRDRAAQRTSVKHPDENPLFSRINHLLRLDNAKFRDVPNPLKNIMQYNRGYYFLPVFFALVKHLGIRHDTLVSHLKTFMDEEFAPLLDKFEKLNDEYVKETATDLSIHTVLFCGSNLYPEPGDFRQKLKLVVKDSEHAILSVTTVPQVAELLRKIQERHFPIKVLRQTNTLKKSSTYVWNALRESWQEMTSDKERSDHISNLWTAIKTFLIEYRTAGGLGGPEEELISKFHVSNVVCSLASDSAMEVKSIAMDRHKWIVRMEDGSLLDLFTGHLGGTVPELYMSDRHFDIRIPRPRLLRLLGEECPLRQLYAHLMTKKFFSRYLKELLLDSTDDLYDTAKELLLEEMPPEVVEYPHADSLLHFYVHFCKYVSFEYDLLEYLMDVMASTMIATNYKRKFFVCKGETSNGKSMLFEIVGRVFGRYYVSIQSDNLKKGKGNSSNPNPDLALTLFSCRIVAMEELEGKLSENRVKQITGLSRVSFRSLYDVSQSAIPTAKVFATTNNVPEVTTTHAFRERVVALPFNSTFVEKAPLTTSQQVLQCLYPKDEYVVELSHVGCFFMLYYHLRAKISGKDGLLHYRDEPEMVVEYTEDYLINTDIYNNFKTHMDVQRVTGGMTTMTDLESAIRQFLNTTKNTTTLETELKIKFEKEFGENRRTDVTFDEFRYTSLLCKESQQPLQATNELLSLSIDEDKGDEDFAEPPPPKKPRTNDSSAVYYEDVVIKNLKRSSAYDN